MNSLGKQKKMRQNKMVQARKEKKTKENKEKRKGKERKEKRKEKVMVSSECQSKSSSLSTANHK